MLSESLRLPSGATLPNRIAKAAMSERIAHRSGAPSEGHLRLYRRWSEGGAGLLVTGNVMVDSRYLGESGNVVLEDARDLGAFRAWAAASKVGGSRVWMQLNHPGRQSPRFVTKEPVAPSAVAMKGAGSQAFAKPRALSDQEIRDVVGRFARAAGLAEASGFDGVQIHGAHGYLVSQFLSRHTNRRDDDWGGDAERRRRFLLEVVRAVRCAVSPHFAVGLKLNSADFQKGGFDEEESMAVVRTLDGEGVDLLEISGGTYEAAAMFEEPRKRDSTRRREAFFLEYAEKVREHAAMPLMVTGGFRTEAGMRDAVECGATDVVGVARPLAAEPDLPRRLLGGHTAHAKPIRLAMGMKSLDAMIQGGWYQWQLAAMAQGGDPDPKLGRWRAALHYLRNPKAFPRAEHDSESSIRPTPARA